MCSTAEPLQHGCQDCPAGAWGAPDSVFGELDSSAAASAAPWELIVQERSADLTYWAWRRPMRGGLYLYMTQALLEGASPAAVRAFHMHDAARSAFCLAHLSIWRIIALDARLCKPQQ
jgi:hypothetical protein